MLNQNTINIAIFAPAAETQAITNMLNNMYPGQYAVLCTFTDLADSQARQQVIDSTITLVIVHQGVDGFTTQGLRVLATKQGVTPRIVVGIVTTHGDIYDVALQYDVIPFRPPVRKSIIEDIHENYPEYLAETIKRFSERDSTPEEINIPESPVPNLMSMPGNVRQALQVLTFWSSKGGVGKSTVAMEMARILADIAGRRVLLVDADVSRGYIGPRLGKEAEEAVLNNRNITNLAQSFMNNGNTLSNVENFVVQQKPIIKGAESNLHVIFGLKSLEQATMKCFLGNQGQQGILFIKSLVQYCQNMGYEFLIFDIGPTLLTPVHRAAIQVASTLMVITTPLYPSIKPTVEGINKLEERDIKSRSQMRLVLNNWVDGPDMVYGKEEYSKFSRITLLGTLPAVHPKEIYPIVNQGKMITDWFIEQKEPSDELEDLIRGYLNLCESFSAGTRSAGSARFENIKNAVKSGREGIHGVIKKKKRVFGLFGGK